ncbi:MAG: hypothetical protein ABSB67_14075 [Bryobacteraceae bacterium]
MRAGILLLAACLTLSSCQTVLHRSVRIDPALEALIPADTVYLFGANLEQLRRTAIYQQLARIAVPELDRFVQDTGVDPRKDLQEVLACSNGNGIVTMVRGTFNSHDLEPKMASRGAPTMSWKGHTLYGTGNTVLAFLAPSIVAAGSTSIIESMIGNSSHGVPDALRPLVDAVPERDQMWAVSAGGLPGPKMDSNGSSSRLGDAMGMLRGIQSVVVGADYSKGLNLTARLDCQTENDAKHVHDALRGAIGMARLSTPDNQPELLKVYDAIQVTQGNSRVDVSADLGADQVDRLLSLWLNKPR